MKRPSLRVVIPSRRRSRVLRQCAHQLFPNATVTVAESEERDYAWIGRDRLVLHPDAVTGIAPIRQWVLDNFDDEGIFFVDDDVQYLFSAVGWRGERVQAAMVPQLVLNAAVIAADIGAPVFGFNQAWDVRKYNPHKPFKLTGWTGGVIGFIGREVRYDEALLMRADIDACLQALLSKRIIWLDSRFSFVHTRFGGEGGNAISRSAERSASEIDYLRHKWGQYLQAKDTSGGTRRLVVTVRR